MMQALMGIGVDCSLDITSDVGRLGSLKLAHRVVSFKGVHILQGLELWFTHPSALD